MAEQRIHLQGLMVNYHGQTVNNPSKSACGQFVNPSRGISERIVPDDREQEATCKTCRHIRKVPLGVQLDLSDPDRIPVDWPEHA